jgi:hypothetical protein
VAVEQDDPAEAVDDQVVDQVAEQVEIRPRRGRERPGEIHVVVRIAQPEQGGPDRALAHRLGGAADDLAQQHAVGEDGQMPPVLLDGRDRHHDRDVLRGPGHRRPAHLLELQDASPPRLNGVRLMTDRVATRQPGPNTSLVEPPRFTTLLPRTVVSSQ